MEHILVVDDDQAILRVISTALKSEGYDVGTAMNGQEAMEEIERDRPSLVLLDMNMPVMNGWAFAGQMVESGYNIPIIVMTAATDAFRCATEIGARGYLGKPFDIIELLEAVEQNKR